MQSACGLLGQAESSTKHPGSNAHVLLIEKFVLSGRAALDGLGQRVESLARIGALKLARTC